MGATQRFFGILSVVLLSACGGGSSPFHSTSTTTESLGGGTTTNTVPTSAGEIETLSFDTTSTTINFPAAGSSSYLLVLNGTNPQSGNTSLQISRNEGFAALNIEEETHADIGPLSEETPLDPAEEFHLHLRDLERAFRESTDYQAIIPSENAAINATPSVGSESNFRVLSSITSISNYTQVPATLRLVTDNLLLYAETEYGDQISDEDIQGLADQFETALPFERNLFGRESDLNYDGHITILFTCNLNKMSASYGGGNFTGFFFIGDLYSPNDYNPASNSQEIFYVMMPDPDGRCGNPISTAFTVENILPGVLVHEYQHMTSAYQHVFVNQGAVEEAWLNEALAHGAEDWTGHGKENASRVRQFFYNPAGTSLVTSGLPNLAERGAGYLFIRYLYEQSEDGTKFIQNLYKTNKTGIANIEEAFAGTETDFRTFSDFIRGWSLALALSGTGWSTDPRYSYQTRTVHETTGELVGACIRGDCEDGRGTVLSGPATTQISATSAISIGGTASGFYEVNNPRGSMTISGLNSSIKGSLIQLQ